MIRGLVMGGAILFALLVLVPLWVLALVLSVLAFITWAFTSSDMGKL